MEGKASDWRPGPTVCRCCLTEGCYKDISTEYFWMGKREVYAEMLAETLNLSIAYSKSGGPNSNSRLICEPCISRLRDASEFKRQVIDCEKTFMHHLDPGSTSKAREVESIGEVKIELVKREKDANSDDDFDDPDFLDIDSDDDLDDQPLTKLAAKLPKKESVDLLDLLDSSQITVKRKSNLKLKAPPKKIVKKKEVVPKPSASKPAATKQAEKKKAREQANRNAELVLQNSTVYPFRLHGKNLLCVYCCDEIEDPEEYRCHMDNMHKNANLFVAFAHVKSRNRAGERDYLKVDCTNLKCRLCNESCDTIPLVAQHLKESHENEAKELDLDYEVGLHPFQLVKDKWICMMCDIKLPTLTNLVRHMSSHFSDHACDLCEKTYLTVQSLKYHKRFYHSTEHICRKCRMVFSTLAGKKEHLKTSSKCWGYACIHCSARFSNWDSKRKHLVSEHNVKATTYPCPDCGAVFDSASNFYYHFKMSHTELPHMCSYCGRRFLKKSQLEDHLGEHTNQKNFQCNDCSRAFSTKKALWDHKKTHLKKKRLDCMYCDKSFTAKVNLKSHMKNVHKQS